ncbi:MAG TPA: lysophospholipid acyltransferase family protein [Acidobacteriota bacterium]|nr:lysophospholipid acyltransferase family protein [Acidobacteriota bacterium]
MARPLHKRLRDGLVYRLSQLMCFLGRITPRPVGYAAAETLGAIGYALAAGERRKTLRNLQSALGEELSAKQLRRIARGMFVHYAKVGYEVSRLAKLSKEKIRELIDFEGLEAVEQAVRDGRGVIAATGHIGNWEMMGAAVSRLGLPVNVIARRINNERLNQLVIGLRDRIGIRTIMRESGNSAKQLLRALRRGELLALLIDQDVRVDGCFVDFFGRPAFTPTGAAALAQRTGALLVAASIQRLDDGRHLVRAVPVEISRNADAERAIITATAEVTAHFERWIRERPEQWCWNHDRWRRAAEAESAT